MMVRQAVVVMRWALCLLAALLITNRSVGAKPDPASAPKPAAEAKAPLAWIKNPVYPKPVWRLWAAEPDPVRFAGMVMGSDKPHEAVYLPPEPEKRLYPDLAAPRRFPATFLAPLVKKPNTSAGWWDDCYATMDMAHTNVPTGWADDYGNRIGLDGQFIRSAFGMPSFSERMQLGVNFTSQSFSERGHHIVSSFAEIDETERDYFFANTVRGTPAYMSYQETLAEKAIDSYDGLFAHSFQSVGRSGSEVGALRKMIIAGGYMPRATKDLLKRHGAYAAAMLLIFRASLPYADAKGEVPYANELRHRVAYFSDGRTRNSEFVPNNVYYHGYNESLHLYRMIEMARQMAVAPPVALLRLDSFAVEKGGKPIPARGDDDPRLKSINRTMIRCWGNPGETLIVGVDMSQSYDLQDLSLRFEAAAVYPEHKNVCIEPGKDGRLKIIARHDPKLPKGRVPVLLLAVNSRGVASLPVFVNFYWPEEGQAAPPPYLDRNHPNPKHEVNRNLRPSLVTGLENGILYAEPGKPASFTVQCKDPEGFPVRLYRWSGEVGTLRGNTFSYTATEADRGKVYPVHLIASDGTGGYRGALVRVVAGPKDGCLAGGWAGAVLGTPEAAGSARMAGKEIEMVASGSELGGSDDAGHIAYSQVEGDCDLAARITELGSPTSPVRAGIVLRQHLEASSPQAMLIARATADKTKLAAPVGLFRGQQESWCTSKSPDPALAIKPALLRLVRRGDLCAAFQSADGLTWEQIGAASVKMSKKIVAGYVLCSGDSRHGDAVRTARARFAPVDVARTPLALIDVKASPAKGSPSHLQAPVEVTILPPAADAKVYYTIDNSDPGPRSPLYGQPFKLDQSGQFTIRARLAGEKTPIVCVVVHVEKPEAPLRPKIKR